MDLRTRFTLFLSVVSFIFLAVFSIFVFQLVRSKALMHDQSSLVGLLEHEWEHVDLPDHQTLGQPGVAHFTDVYLQIQKNDVVIYNSFQSGVPFSVQEGFDLNAKRVFHSIWRERYGNRYQITGYFDLTSTFEYLGLLKRILIFGSFISVLILIPLSRAITRFLLKPFHQLAAETSAISAENLSFRFHTPKFEDEHGLLVRNFNSLLNRLENSFQLVRRFASNASHELRTPLAVVIGQSEMALRRERSPAEYRAIIAKSLDRAKDLRNIINRLLYLSELDHLAQSKNEPFSVKQFVQEIAETLGQIYQQQGKRFEIEERSSNEIITANRQILSSVIMNLVENALKYSQERSKISWEVTNSEIQFFVSDDGPGIPNEKFSIVFEPFTKLPVSAGGRAAIQSYGLGLSIVRACLNTLKGTIELGRSSWGGLLVRVRIPIYSHKITTS